MSTVPFFQIDAFTSQPFRGNPAAVVRLEGEWPSDADLLAVAIENNLSETAFVRASADDGSDFDLRWFTPGLEVDLCGHATLATAHALFTHGGFEPGTVRFLTRSGVLTATRHDDGSIELDFPALSATPTAATADLTAALGAEPTHVFTGHDLMAVFEHKRQIDEMSPDMVALAKIDARGVIVTAPGAKHDFVSRFFAPRCGVPEDPVTGSAHCMLAPYWASRLGRDSLSAHQVSKRGGELACRVVGDRVKLRGHAVTTIEGRMRMPSSGDAE